VAGKFEITKDMAGKYRFRDESTRSTIGAVQCAWWSFSVVWL